VNPYDGLLYRAFGGETIDVSAAANSLVHVLTEPVLLEHAAVTYVSVGAAVSTRFVELDVLDASNNVLAPHAGDLAQLGDLTRYYAFGRGLPSDAAFVNGTLRRPLLLYRLEAGWKLRVQDNDDTTENDTIRLVASVRPIGAVIA